MATPAKPWKAEYARSGTSFCKRCKFAIANNQLRFAKVVPGRHFDGPLTIWNHARCILEKANQIKSFDDVEGIDLLRWEDQQKILKYVEGGPLNNSGTPSDSAETDCAIEVSQTYRAGCKRCNEKIVKGTVRVSTLPQGQGAKGVAYHHIHCFIQMHPSIKLEKLSGWDSLPFEEKNAVDSLTKKDTSTTKRASEQSSKGTKRKKEANDEQKSEAPKTDGNVSASGESSRDYMAADLETKLKEQTNALWKIIDELKKHVAITELREMLEANDQDSSGSKNDLLERCADGMLFGALGKCVICSGSLHYSERQYRCRSVSAWSQCSYSTTEPLRLKQKWKIPKEMNNEHLINWSKSQKAKKPDRILRPSKPLASQTSSVKSQTSYSEKLEDLKIAIAGELKGTMVDWKRKLVEAGGKIHAKITKDTSCLVLSGEMQDSDSEIKKARRMKIPIVRDDYLGECIKNLKKLPFDLYEVEAASETSEDGMQEDSGSADYEASGSAVHKASGSAVHKASGSAVHEASGMQETGHILEDGKSIYNTTLSMCDLVTGVNSYYILQIIEENKGYNCYVFRKWGRVGNKEIGSKKLEKMSKDDAIEKFKCLFLGNTKNPWEAWELKQNFQKHPGKFFPVDIDTGVKEAPEMKVPSEPKSPLAPQLVELMEMLVNVATYRDAMLGFKINMSKMPLGMLSKSIIKKGFEILTEIQNILNSTDKNDPAVKESLILDASNRFFTLIPSIHPHVIRDEDDFDAKVKMLEALQNIEIALRLVGFHSDKDEPLEDKYKKLHCDMTPLPHDSEDYRLIEKYLLNTHASTHEYWSLELEEVFALEREGEFDKYAPYRDKLKNKMLLWHGSGLANFVGILSQGLRIAPPEAPATGYMFGKGVYFADLVSKSAQYCCVDIKDPVGLMLLSEVALGEIHELKKATYMDKPPSGKHSTKGLGKMMPLESEFEKWRDVVVPCGKPVPSSVGASKLMHNEYIVYNTAQVKMQFLLKVKFHFKM